MTKRMGMSLRCNDRCLSIDPQSSTVAVNTQCAVGQAWKSPTVVGNVEVNSTLSFRFSSYCLKGILSMRELFLRSVSLCCATIAALCTLTSGCGSATGPGMSPVSGKVTFKGEGVGPGTVAFVPADPAGNPATGNIDKSGNFQMSVHKPGDGVLPGTYKVAISVEKTPAYGDEKGNLFPPTYLSPERYMNPETSGFTVTVEKGKSQTVKFDMQPD